MPGQTLADIRSTLAAAGISPLHRFGQNFLIDLNLMRKVAEAAELSAEDVALEVGPGTGSLTEFLLDSGARVIAVEIDRGFQKILARRFADQPRFRLIAGDALAGKNELNPAISAALDEWCGERWQEANRTPGKLVANLPYQIATPLILELLAREPRVGLLVCTIQKEVGEKLLATPGTADYGPLAIVVQSVATVERIALLPASAFWPAPKVDSVLVRIRRKTANEIPFDKTPAFSAFVRDSFQQRRKTIRNAAKRWASFAGDTGARGEYEQLLAACGVNPTQRPEELSVETWQRLFRRLHGLLPSDG